MLIVILPLAILGWLGLRLVQGEREIVQHRFRELLLSNLRDVDRDIAQLLDARERTLLSERALSSYSPAALRERVRKSGVVKQYFVLDAKGELLYPPPQGPLTATEEAFLDRTGQIWLNHEIPMGNTEDGPPATITQANYANINQQQPKLGGSQKGWHVWYWGSGLNLIFWWRDDSGTVVGAELNRARFMADVVGMLPDTNPLEPELLNAGIALVDSKGAAIYQWGRYEPAERELPQTTLPLSHPLGAWKLDYYAPSEFVGATYGRGVVFNVLSGLGVLAVAMIALAIYFYRESTREMREAAQRVSFVNQVSHELKTPLTSIRMYAEMLEADLGEHAEKPKRHLDIIVSESQRLSRLIGNVLTFSRKQRSALKLHTAPGNIDEALRAVLDNFEASLRARGIEPVFSGGASHEAEFDRDVLEQITGNLLSNVEKYASSGDRVEIASRQDGDTVTITVADNGPGIPPDERKRVFESFYRVSNKLTDGVAGTGIGLAVARDLARLHDGDLTLEPSSQGASFRLVLHVPLCGSRKDAG